MTPIKRLLIGSETSQRQQQEVTGSEGSQRPMTPIKKIADWFRNKPAFIPEDFSCEDLWEDPLEPTPSAVKIRRTRKSG